MAEIIVDRILWTDSAKLSFNKIVKYLKKTWSDREIVKFVKRTTEVLSTLQRFAEMCRPSLKRKNVRIALLNNHTQMVYYYKPGTKQIDVLLFWGMKQNPAKFNY